MFDYMKKITIVIHPDSTRDNMRGVIKNCGQIAMQFRSWKNKDMSKRRTVICDSKGVIDEVPHHFVVEPTLQELHDELHSAAWRHIRRICLDTLPIEHDNHTLMDIAWVIHRDYPVTEIVSTGDYWGTLIIGGMVDTLGNPVEVYVGVYHDGTATVRLPYASKANRAALVHSWHGEEWYRLAQKAAWKIEELVWASVLKEVEK